jgi:hypothetical protein
MIHAVVGDARVGRDVTRHARAVERVRAFFPERASETDTAAAIEIRLGGVLLTVRARDRQTPKAACRIAITREAIRVDLTRAEILAFGAGVPTVDVRFVEVLPMVGAMVCEAAVR